MTGKIPDAYLMFAQVDYAKSGEYVLDTYLCTYNECAMFSECNGGYSGKHCEYVPGKIAALRHIIDLCNAKIAELEATCEPTEYRQTQPHLH